jgi:hypothetical protein
MDGDQRKERNIFKEKDGNGLFDSSYVFQPSWIRCPICFSDEVDKLILDYGYYLLHPFALILWAILFALNFI